MSTGKKTNLISYDDSMEFLGTAQQALASDDGDTALDSLGWWELLDHLDDPQARLAVFSVFRAQGGGLASSSALSGLAARPYVAALGMTNGAALATLGRRSRHGSAAVVVGEIATRVVLVDLPGRGVVVIEPGGAPLRAIELPGGQILHEVVVDPTTRPTLDDNAAAPLRARSHWLSRVAITLEILGAAEQVLTMATTYANDRQQFGQPIGSFQAIRHLLAWARTDCTAIEAIVYQALRMDQQSPAGFDEIAKAIAGRNGRKVCERTLQVFGGIGFTAEHDHHHFHSRVLALDSLVGTSSDLMVALGARLRTDRAHLGLPGGLLYPTHAD